MYSDELNSFIYPDFSHGEINIPYFVSNGYLVFVPDIPKIIGNPGRSAYNAIVGGAKYLSGLTYIDKHRMGLNGHSFGGFETNYIVTHSNIFAAAISSSGMSDFISCYGSIFALSNGTSRQRQYEIYHDAMGGDLWSIKENYLENSPVLAADKVLTPLLMMNNIADDDVPFAQGVEFFTALRRLGKTVWMLQYDNERHMNYGQADDFTKRMKQFFDFYLKGNAAPKWMVEGIPATRKGSDAGFELEPPGVVPGPSLLQKSLGNNLIPGKVF